MIEKYKIQTNEGYGWQTEITVYTLVEARAQARRYRSMSGGRYATRIRRTREVM